MGRFSTFSSISESFVLTPSRGSVAYFASTHLGIVHYLDIYNTRIYNSVGNTMYGRSFGEQIVEAIKQVYNLTTTDDYYARFHVEEMGLHGDPAIKINAQSKPDYVIEDQLVKITPSFVSVSGTSFNVKAKFLNLGKAINKKITIEVKRQYPNSVTEIVYRDTIEGIRYADSISINLPIVATRDKGRNRIIITVDADNEVDEIYETNNSVTKDVIIYSDDTSPIYPYQYSIVNKQNITFSASTSDPYAPFTSYKVEVDTTELFNSSLKVSQTINAKGGLLEFKPSISFADSTVYYWRVAKVANPDSMKWAGSSFIYLSNSDLGFNQSHYYQQVNTTKDRLILDSLNRTWKFDKVLQNLTVRMGTYISSGATGNAQLTVVVNGNVDAIVGLTSWFQSLVFNVFDPNTFKPSDQSNYSKWRWIAQ
ncbi:MAG: C25 family cysteine peptidase [Chitinophagaceae bacterium]